MTGEITQLETMEVTALQLTASTAIPTEANPMIAPTMEWVVETGHPRRLAISRQHPAARGADSMPETSRCGVSVMGAGSTMPLRMVAVTSPPARYAPRNSNIMAITIACRMVKAREPTEVPMALATSLAPIPQAINTPKTQARISKMWPYSAITVMMCIP